MDSHFDVIIIGAGPAGSSCAYNLLRFNPKASVLIIDKATFPRDKVCGGGISPEVFNYLDFDFDEVIDFRCKDVEMVANGQTITSKKAEILMVRRSVFDHFLLKKAMQKGVQTRLGCEVTHIDMHHAHPRVKTQDGDFYAQFVVIAEGGLGKLARKLGIAPKNKIVAGMEYEHYTEKGNGTVQINFDYNEDFYAWNFPKSDGLSLGIGGFIKGRKKNGVGLPKKLKKYVNQFNEGAFEKSNMHGHPIQLYNGRHTLVHRSVILIGEIAGCVDPLTAEGIRPAIKSGYLAATVLAEILVSNTTHGAEQYNELFHQQIGKDFQYARILSHLANNYRSVLLPRLSSATAIACFMSVFSGKTTYRAHLSCKKLFKIICKIASHTMRGIFFTAP